MTRDPTTRDPTFDTVFLRELKGQGRSCKNCRFNLTRGRKRCQVDHKAWPEGPCRLWEPGELDALFR